MILVRFMYLKFLRWTRRETGRNFKFTALVGDAQRSLTLIEEGAQGLWGPAAVAFFLA
jgi:hypothetical protein